MWRRCGGATTLARGVLKWREERWDSENKSAARDCVTDRWHRRRDARLAHPSRQLIARQEMHVRLIGRLVDPCHRVVVVVGLLDLSLLAMLRCTARGAPV